MEGVRKAFMKKLLLLMLFIPSVSLATCTGLGGVTTDPSFRYRASVFIAKVASALNLKVTLDVQPTGRVKFRVSGKCEELPKFNEIMNAYVASLDGL